MACLSQMMVSFRERYPEVTFEIFTAIADDVKEQIDNGMLDFGLMLEPVEISKYHFIRLPLREKWCVLMRRDSSLAEKERITPADLAGVPLMIAKRKSVRNELENWFGEYYEKLNIVVTRNLSYSNCCIMVENHVGAALVLAFENTYENLCLRPLFPEMETRSVLVWKKNQVLSPAVAKFVEWAKNAV